MKNIKYDRHYPLDRIEKGDDAVIRYTKSPIENEKDKKKYADIPTGNYKAICTGPYELQCDIYPELSGRYTCRRGQRWGTTALLYADEPNGQELSEKALEDWNAVQESYSFTETELIGYCPHCYAPVLDSFNPYYCGKCGLAIKWIK